LRPDPRYGGAKETITMAIGKDLLEILACPQCKGEVTLTAAGDGLQCPKCKLLYPIKDDIPIMLIDEARRLE
jgi:hypothetical protein